MSVLGFKDLALANWTERDPVLDVFVKVTQEGVLEPLEPDALVAEILLPQIQPSIPQDVRALFEVARGCMCYGCFFYPLFTLATEQLYRVIEAGVRARVKALSEPMAKKTYQSQIDFLIENGVIPQADRLRWVAIRELRNIASHPYMQEILPPGNAIHRLGQCAETLNSLFAGA